MSARTVCYKGMLLAYQVGEYYLDLKDPRVESALALVHQRFSTNTFPSWDLAHPFRMICHNGEINTLRGNINWIRARQGAISSPMLGRDLDKVWPLIYDGQSDSASFDNALELLVMGGYSVAHAMMMMIPEAWENHTLMDPARRAFYEYHAAMMEPWDGPASIAFTDGLRIGATLDRNGLRPSRYIVTSDDLVIMGSECGCLPVPEEKIVKKWRLQPGKMFLVDLEKGRIIDDKELKETLASARPYAEWIERIRVKLDEVETEKTPPLKSPVALLDRQQAFGYTQEDLKFQMEPMAANGEEPVGSMGNDASLAVLSKKNKTLYHYFKQLFAQVTNPAIDPIREELVTSLVCFIGPKPNLLGIDEMNPPLRLEVSQPVLDFYEMEKVRYIERYTGGKFRSQELDITYPVAWGKEAIEARLASLCAQAEDAVRSGYSIVVVSDRLVDRERVAIPALLALSAIHQHLVSKGLRTSTGLVVETGSAREVHHFALLGGYGAEAVHPYLALETLLALHPEDRAAGSKAIKNYVKAIGKGLKKVMSKMGISTYMSYTGAQIFEAVGLARSLVDKYFSGTTSSVGGIGVFEVAEEAIRIHRDAFDPNDPVLAGALDAGGEYAWRVRGEEHMWTPDAIAKLQHSARSNSYQTYQEYAAIIMMARKLRTEQIERLSMRTIGTETAALRDRGYLFALEHAPAVFEAVEGAAQALAGLGVDDRAVDLWTPLIAIAQVVDQTDGTMAATGLLRLARDLSGARDAAEADSTAARLAAALPDIRRMWTLGPDATITPTALLAALARLSGFEWLRSTKALQTFLAAYGLYSRGTWVPGKQNSERRYHLTDEVLRDLQDRYGPPPTGEAPAPPPEPAAGP